MSRVSSLTNPAGDDWLSVFAQRDGVLDGWECVWHERARRFGASDQGEGKRVVGVRWLDEERRVSAPWTGREAE